MENIWILLDERLNNFYQEYKIIIDWVIDNNKTDAPYHDTNHLIGVGYLAWLLSGEDRNTTYAGLLHDFCYARKKPDFLNIHSTLDSISRIYHIDKEVKSLIEESEYQFTNPLPKGISDLGKYLRDADQLYSSYFFNDRILKGLMEELGGSNEVEFLIRNIEYVSDLPLFTEEAKQLDYEILPFVIKEHTSKLKVLISK